ncbi:hypothetical protein BJY52DRAFT_1188866 [Lactarius psammicola]|nr:hypothetical protein BJY52DRAFT_1188866 [Lactarius psammicola]
MHRPPASEDEDSLLAALEQSDRVYSIGLTVSSSLLNKLSTISRPFSGLEKLRVLVGPSPSYSPLDQDCLSLPPSASLPSRDLVDLQLNEIPGVGYFSPEAFANALCGVTQLETLSLHFLSLPPRRNYPALPPPSWDRVNLPTLTCFRYRGISKYLDNLVARINAPRLGDIDITFFSQPTLDAWQLGLFINCIEMWRSPLRAEILSSRGAISISITSTQPGTLARLGLQISCEQLDWQLSFISQICDHFFSFLFSVGDLGIMTIGSSSVPDDMDNEQWLRLIRAFGGAKDFRVAGELVTDVLCAIRPTDEEHNTALPSLRNLHVQNPMSMRGPPRDSVESFVTQRRLSGHPLQKYYSYIRRPTAEEVASAKRWVKEQKRSTFNRSSYSFEAVSGSPVPDSEIHEYIRNLKRLDMVLGNVERYIHTAFATLKNEDPEDVTDIIGRVIDGLHQIPARGEQETEPTICIKLRKIREMVQNADNMDKSLRTGLGVMLAVQGNAPVPQRMQQPPSVGLTRSLAQPARAAPPVTSQVQAGVAVSTPPLVPTVSIPPPQAATPGITDSPPQTPKSPKWKAAAKPRASVHCKVPINANNLETASSAHAVTLTPTSSTPMDTKGGVKRIREDETDSATLGVASASSSKRVKSDWEGPPNEEAQKSEERAENVRTGEQALALFETVTDSIDETPESGQNYINNVLARLRDVQVLDQVSAQPPNEHNHTNLGRGV